jgi:hypothetical protein
MKTDNQAKQTNRTTVPFVLPTETYNRVMARIAKKGISLDEHLENLIREDKERYQRENQLRDVAMLTHSKTGLKECLEAKASGSYILSIFDDAGDVTKKELTPVEAFKWFADAETSHGIPGDCGEMSFSWENDEVKKLFAFIYELANAA